MELKCTNKTLSESCMFLTFSRSFNICSIKFLSECLMSFHIYIWRKLDCYAELLQSQIKIKQIKKNVKDATNQLEDANIYEEATSNAKPLLNIILNTLENIHKRGDVCTDTLILIF